MLLMGLRLAGGISLARFEEVGGRAPAQCAIDALVELGLLHHDRAQARIAATPQGRLVLNSVIAAL
jgi:oxygen-independent coproporphyrinogen-3 oxidase